MLHHGNTVFSEALDAAIRQQALAEFLNHRLRKSFQRRNCQTYTDTGQVIDEWLGYFRTSKPEIMLDEEQVELAMAEVEKAYILGLCA